MIPGAIVRNDIGGGAMVKLGNVGTNTDGGIVKLGNEGKKIDELDEPGAPVLDGAAEDGEAGATVVPEGAPESAGAKVSPGVDPTGTDSGTTDTAELFDPLLESSPPRVL